MMTINITNDNEEDPPSVIPSVIRRRFRPPMRRPSILPSLLYRPIDFDFDNLSHPHSQIVDRLRAKYSDDNDIEELDTVLETQSKKNKELEIYKTNYQQMMQKIPTSVIKDIMTKNESKCSVCLDDHKDIFNETFIITSCFHLFHEKCLTRSFSFNKKCPLCRSNLKNTYYKKFQINIINKDISTFN